MPEDQLARHLAEPPDLAVALRMRESLDISLEAALRCLVERHDESVAAVWTRDGVIRSIHRAPGFPWIERKTSEMVSSRSRTWTRRQGQGHDATGNAPGARGSSPSAMREVDPAAWTTVELYELSEQVHDMSEGHAVTLLWATSPGENNGA